MQRCLDKFTSLLDGYEQSNQWLELAKQFDAVLADGQKVELNGLMQYYGKALQGYNAQDYLQQSPRIELERLIIKCSHDDQVASSPIIQKMKDKLLALRNNGSAADIQQASECVNEALAELQTKQNPGIVQGAIAKAVSGSQHVQDLLIKIANFLNRYRDYLSGKNALLSQQIASVVKVYGDDVSMEVKQETTAFEL